MAASLEGRHIVVTGGTGNLGGAVLARLTAEGAICHVPVRGTDMPADTAGIRHVSGVDLTDPGAVDAFYGEIGNLWASVHLAGGFGMGGIVDADDRAMSGMFEMNALSAWLCCRAAIRAMKAAGPARGGRIVNIAARPALEPRSGAGMAAYAASKAAVAAITQALGEELKGDGILVNAVAPSILDTPENRAAMPKADFAKWPSLESAAGLIAFLVSPDNSSTSSAVIPLYGRA
ncbi:MAG: SDR family NAD(P)-dependent oxidoreductase [Pseudomonadota bacterium]|nr:SDR family NAD(P)-dependent oxidoreductase [Pseudomonadota bacterium]